MARKVMISYQLMSQRKEATTRCGVALVTTQSKSITTIEEQTMISMVARVTTLYKALKVTTTCTEAQETT